MSALAHNALLHSILEQFNQIVLGQHLQILLLFDKGAYIGNDIFPIKARNNCHYLVSPVINSNYLSLPAGLH